jgi:hypothetical protein
MDIEVWFRYLFDGTGSDLDHFIRVACFGFGAQKIILRQGVSGPYLDYDVPYTFLNNTTYILTLKLTPNHIKIMIDDDIIFDLDNSTFNTYTYFCIDLSTMSGYVNRLSISDFSTSILATIFQSDSGALLSEEMLSIILNSLLDTGAGVDSSSIQANISVDDISGALLLKDSFTDTDDVLLKNHIPDTNNTGNVWIDPNDRFKISSNELIGLSYGAGESKINLGTDTCTIEYKFYETAGSSAYLVFRCSAAGTNRLQLFQNMSLGTLQINAPPGGFFASGVYVKAAINTWHTISIILTADRIIVKDSEGLEIINIVSTTYNANTYIGLMYWPAGSAKFDNLRVTTPNQDSLLIMGSISLSDTGALSAETLAFLNSFSLTDTGVGFEISRSFLFDGITDYINFGQILDYVSGNFSFSFRAKHESFTGNYCAFWKGDMNVNGYYFMFGNAGGYFATNQSGAFQYSGSSDFGLDTNWHNFIIVRNGTSVKIYIDGIEEVLEYVGVHIDPTTSNNDFKVGVENTSSNYEGHITDFRVFNKALTDAEAKKVSAYMDVGGLDLWAKCNETYGTVCADSSGHSRDGVITGPVDPDTFFASDVPDNAPGVGILSQIPLSDSVSGVDIPSIFSKLKVMYDAGVGIDVVANILSNVGVSDTNGITMENLELLALLVLADSSILTVENIKICFAKFISDASTFAYDYLRFLNQTTVTDSSTQFMEEISLVLGILVSDISYWGIDDVDIAVTLDVADTVSGADLVSVFTNFFSKLVTDASISVSEDESILAFISPIDSVKGYDIVTGLCPINLTDSVAMCAELLSIFASISFGDTGAGVDGLPEILVSILLSDSLSMLGEESLTLLVQLLINEAGLGIDNTSILASVSVVDLVSLWSETASVLQTLLITDNVFLSAEDIITVLVNQILIDDIGIGAETLLEILASISIVDDVSLISTEVISILNTLSVSDVGTGVEALLLLVSLLIAENGGLSDEVINYIQLCVVQDAGVAAESLAVFVKLELYETGLGIDILEKVYLLSVADNCILVVDELVNIFVQVILDIDSGIGLDDVQKLVQLGYLFLNSNVDPILRFKSKLIKKLELKSKINMFLEEKSSFSD